MPITNSKFKPAWWMRNPHLQTIWGTTFKKIPNIRLISQRIELDDGDFIDVSKTPNILNKPIVLMLHGLEGSIDSHYAKSLIQQLDKAGFAVVFMHFRGCSGELNRLQRSYSSGDSPDLQSVVTQIEKDHSRHPFAVIGFSLGGNVTLKWMGEKAQSVETSVSVAVSVPFDLSDCSVKLENGFSRIYQRHLVSACQKKFRQKEKLHPKILEGKVDIDELNTFFTFDNEVTAPLNGYKNADDYYQKCSNKQFLKSIRKPTLILHAKDDPFMWKHNIPKEHELSKHVQLELSENGGHVGFVGGLFPWKNEYWLDKRIVQWLEEQRDNLL